jgi:hypothetical protein
MVSVAGTIPAISDSKALSLFRAVVVSEIDCSSIIITRSRLTRKLTSTGTPKDYR